METVVISLSLSSCNLYHEVWEREASSCTEGEVCWWLHVGARRQLHRELHAEWVLSSETYRCALAGSKGTGWFREPESARLQSKLLKVKTPALCKPNPRNVLPTSVIFYQAHSRAVVVFTGWRWQVWECLSVSAAKSSWRQENTSFLTRMAGARQRGKEGGRSGKETSILLSEKNQKWVGGKTKERISRSAQRRSARAVITVM